MNCQEARTLVEDVMDRRLSGDVKRRLDLHLSRCAECRDFFAEERDEHTRWFRALNYKEEKRTFLSHDFADRLVAAVMHTPKRSFWNRIRIPRWVGMAACLAIAVSAAAMVAGVVVREVSGDSSGTASDAAFPAGESAAGYAGLDAAEPVSETTDELQGMIENETENSGTAKAVVSQTTEGDARVSVLKNIKRVLAAVVLTTAAATSADDNQLFVSGYPAANAFSSSASAGLGIETSSLAKSAESAQLEARYRTWLESAAVGLRSDKHYGMFLIVR